MKYASIFALAASALVIASCEKKNNEEGTAAPGMENSMQVEQARFAANMVGIPLGKYVPVSEAQKAAPGSTVYVKGSILRKSVPAKNQDDVFIVVDPEKVKAELVDGKVKAVGEPTPAEILDNTMIARFPVENGSAPAFEELDEVLIIGTMEESTTDKESFKTIKVQSIGKHPKSDEQ